MNLKKIKDFLWVFLFVQAGSLTGEVLSRYRDYQKFPHRYEAAGMAWYDGLFPGALLALLVMAATLAVFLIIHRELKKEEEQKKP